jgi:SlyX protein
MGDGSNSTQRLDDLEAHIAHQDSTIDDLNQVVLEQWNEIKALGGQIARLEAKIQTMEQGAEGEATPEPPPPHY